MQSTTSIVSHVYPARYVAPLFRVRQIMDLCHTVGNECWVTVTCIVDPSNDGATITLQVTRVNLVRGVFLHNIRQTSTHKCGLELGLQNTQVSKRRNSRFSHHETALDRLIVVQETEIGDSTESRFGCITKEVDLSVNWWSRNWSIKSRRAKRFQVTELIFPLSKRCQLLLGNLFVPSPFLILKIRLLVSMILGNL